MSGIYIALGSNLGDRRANIARAVELLPPEVEVEAISPIYESAPQPPAPPPAYFNAVCRVRTQLSPEALLAHLKQIEAKMGRRQRPAERWAPRVIDLDLILYNDETMESPSLTLPHPRMRERAFVLVPLRDLGVEIDTMPVALAGLQKVT
ncbi:MAG: 2-amino-4-hydroxy-6-hydroxymethyldihydropteridine diphosphokinase [Dehalococcoidia bacterium]